jgi:hypothetical protein
MHTVALLVESNFRDIVDIDWSKRHWSVVREQEAKCCSILYTVIGVIRHAVWPYGGEVGASSHSRSVQGTGGGSC